MSDISLNANVYQVSKRYYAILDQFLSRVKSQQHQLTDDDRKPVFDLFTTFSNEQNNDPQLHMITIIVDRSLRMRNKKFKEIVQKITNDLDNQTLSDESLNGLEDIAMALDNERVHALTRMKGLKR
jgi:hypothetical protein